MANGIVENEICPVAVARTSGEPNPIPGEVGAWEWLGWPDFLDFVLHSERPDVSPWCVLQCRELAAVDDVLATYCRGEIADIPQGDRI
jgi:isopentenyl-diphosphate delta-isomerase